MLQNLVPDLAPNDSRLLIHAPFGVVLLLGSFFGGCGDAVFDPPIECDFCVDWNQPQEPFRIFANTYYVGVAGLSSILIDTGDGLVLIDGGLPQSATLIHESIRKLGFDIKDVSLILVSHVHFDHVGGIAALQRLSGATVLTSNAGKSSLDIGMLEDNDPQFSVAAKESWFPACSGVRAVFDEEILQLGDTEIRALYTPGHTPGGISWTWLSCDGHECLNVVYADSLSPISADGYMFSTAPRIAADNLKNSAKIIAALKCDIFLSNHPFRFDMKAKLVKNGDANPFVDTGACINYADSSLASLQRRLTAEEQSLH
ncbi:MAG: subclass B3 metallo-beta-lactamase [Gammaproteobacteria bacterium]|nr:subclass B3 metallo-beta-lactamase [Gammaproteobacteria bacterium]